VPESTPRRGLLDAVDVPRIRTRFALPVLGVTVLGAMLGLGGAWNPSIPLFAVTAAAALFLSGVDRPTVLRDPVTRLLLVLLAVGVFQLLPLPPALLRLLDRGSEEASRLALAAWRIDRAAAWRPLHRDPGTGYVDLVYLLGLGAAYLAAAQAARREVLERLYEICAASALVAALVAFAHVGTGQDQLYGFYRPVQASPPVISPLLNPNHLAALTGAGAILWLGLALASEKPLPRVLHGIAAVACGGACAMSLSRGGVASAVGGVLLLLALDARTEGAPGSRKVRRRPALQTLLGYLFAGAIFLAGAWLSAGALAREFSEGDASKLAIFRRAVAMLRGHELLGHGSGSLPVVSATGERLSPEHTFLRVESLPLDLALSVGVVATAAVIYFALRAFRRWLPPAGAPTPALAAWAALLSLAAHDLVDFSLYLGGVGYFAAVLAGVLSGWTARAWRKPLPRSESLARWPGVAAFVTAALLAVVAARSGLEHERDRAERSLRASATWFETPEAQAVAARHPSDAYLQLLMGSYAVAAGHPAGLRFVARALSLAPTWAQPHLLLGRVLAAGNRRGQTLLEVREVLARTTSQPGPCAQLVMRLRPLPTREELQRVAPRHLGGVAFLHGVAAAAPTPEYAAMADELLLERAPDFVPALQRRATAARAAGDLDGASVWCERIERARASDVAGAMCRVDVFVARGDSEAALRTLDRALPRVQDRYPLHLARARLLAAARNAAGMRREAALMQEAAGADLERLIESHGLRGELEAALGNLRGALAAYEMAETLALPDHPYALQMAQIASRLGDREVLQARCTVLLEQDPSSEAALRLCDPVGARRAGLVRPADGGP
jgi:tetratricopeptide (TPR) repeat protein